MEGDRADPGTHADARFAVCALSFFTFTFCGAPRGQYALVHGPFPHFAFGARVTPRLRAPLRRLSRQGPGITTITAENHFHYKNLQRPGMSAERAHPHMTIGIAETTPRTRSPAGLRNFTCGNQIHRVSAYVRTKPYKPHYCPSESAPDDRGKVDDSPRSRSTRAAPEHTHSVERTGY